LNINLSGGTPASGDSYLIKPFNTAATNVQAQFSTPRSLAVASPIAVSAASTNQGSLTVSNLAAQNLATPIANYSITFSVTGAGTTYNVIDNTTPPGTAVLSAQPYVAGQAITYAPTGVAGFSLTLTGAPANGDTMTVEPNPYPAQDGGNATAIMNLRDTAMFDGAALTDGYAAAIAQLGIRSQSANYSAQVSTNLATSASTAATAVSGVNLDEEAAKLLQYQQAYQASSKMIQIAQTIFQSLIQGLT
jgi:flagellar hook-associated protein 1 FlgK